MGLLFKNGTVITASDMTKADVLVEGEVITLIGQNISADGHEVVDCTGQGQASVFSAAPISARGASPLARR
jgi:dihydroorotase-like cyclic amidohydrolase